MSTAPDARPTPARRSTPAPSASGGRDATARSTTHRSPPTNVAELLRRLGDIPPERVRLDPTPGTATRRDHARVEKETGRLFELVDGTLVEKPVGFEESSIAARIIALFVVFVEARRLGGVVNAPDGTIEVIPGQLREPDVAYYSRENLRRNKRKGESNPRISPDLAVEVLSKSNSKAEMARKLDEYFRGGTRLAWIVDPKKRTVRVHTAPTVSTLFGENDTLDGGDVLPGFSVVVREFFPEDD